MKFIKNNYAQAEGGVLIGIAVVILLAIIVILGWDPISHAISQFLKATCVSDPKSPWNNC